MKTIYELQKTSEALSERTESNSISPQDTFGLAGDVLEYIADLERNNDSLGIRKVYKSYAEMAADTTAPVGNNGKTLRFGQLVAVYDADNTTQSENGNVYAYQGNTSAPWLLMGNIAEVMNGTISNLQTKLTQEIEDRTAGDTELQEKMAEEARNRGEKDAQLESQIGTTNGKLEAEKSARTNADDALAGKISANSGAIAQEQAQRTAADTVLEGKITTNSNGLSAANNRITDVEKRLNEAAGGGLEVSVKDDTMIIS